MEKKTELRVTTDDVLTVGKAAKLLGVSRMTVYRWIESGKMIAIEIGGVTFVSRKIVEGRKDEGNGKDKM